MVVPKSAPRARTRERVIEVAAQLLAEGGREAVSTRAVSAAAGIQAPAIYRIFGDMQGLLDAVAVHGCTVQLKSKAYVNVTDDPVADLREGWDGHVGFGLSKPDLYALIYGGPRPNTPSPAADAADDMLADQIHRIAEAGRLRVPEALAVQLFSAAVRGATLTLIAIPEDDRDMTLSNLAREAVIAATTNDAPAPPPPGLVDAAVTLRAILPQTSVLSAHESDLLKEWLDRIAAGHVVLEVERPRRRD